MIAPPLRRDAAPVSTDKRRRRTGALGAVASVFIRPVTNDESVNLSLPTPGAGALSASDLIILHVTSSAEVTMKNVDYVLV